MSRNQRLRPIQPIYEKRKMLGGSGTGNSPSSFALAAGGTITTNTPTLVEHTYDIAGTTIFVLLNAGTLNVTYTIVPSATFGGNGSSGTMAVTSSELVNVTTGSVVVSYNPTTDWTPA